MSALKEQVGGNHYKKYKIQPAEYAHANNLDFFQGSVVKYITRFRDKNGKQDLEKIKHLCDFLIELEYNNTNEQMKHIKDENATYIYRCIKPYSPCKLIDFIVGEKYEMVVENNFSYIKYKSCQVLVSMNILKKHFVKE